MIFLYHLEALFLLLKVNTNCFYLLLLVKLFTFFIFKLSSQSFHFFYKKINVKNIQKNPIVHLVDKVLRNVCVNFEVLMLK